MIRLLIITQKVDESDDVLGFFCYWIRELAKRADKVFVICLSKGESSLPKNVHVISLGKEKNFPKVFQAILFYYYAFKFLIRTDGVFVHMAPEYVKAIHPINFFFRRPIVMWYAHIKVSPVAKWAIDRVNYILTPSKESFEFNSDKVVATGHGINTEIFKPIERKFVGDVLTISRISKVKRIETLIESVRILAGRGTHPTVNIYGKPARPEDDEYLSELKESAENLPNIHWQGGVPNKDAPEVYANHKIFVRMQGGGGFGKTELEAMSMGVPSIVPTSVYQRHLGKFANDLFFNEDDSEALANRIEKVLSWGKEDKDEYSKMARRLVVEKHNVENVADTVIRLLKQ
ncbi:MAG: hypothetical protein A2741_00420 [Candidatus Zambryskibacteria bacterium RIFCSPHIGHO2_01_FULL_43_27]|uniref:Glycosyl transferase family 1 domain-containing protein n=1 Tax=Candidatus Zambryskibacteria bacterium RIFCSPLOWO2_01_FULL_43_17 TaxID=1802760 RepID=A0A1G2U217_9BACT|nr:MAG: hypothetical protein A2741_00420 [Candidatus Zambryskibacteria bacterium RIFCSPHIGHO2_01_FULL_43_27]OHB00449.1 MAG: hypothetical protein A3E93_01295 [Candidatus Zambryskibacteria bacterium RIFCSPHIGHO2_12_FULL_43_12b]OHB03558.1 MAG: hypothetical protein A2920_02755 [Candidatus Zambryskibacteria bacterium RIFCSPLOWO2_01_FULL_43_17]